jgi:RND superfamily putative drug exporter
VLLLAFAPAAETDVTPTSGLPDGAESTSVSRLQASLPSTDVAPAIVVFDRDGDRLTRADLSAIRNKTRALAPFSISADDGLRPVPAQDQTAVLVPVPMSLAVSDAELRTSIESIREELGTGLPEGLRAQVTGAPAYEVDLSAVFDGADVTLLLATVGVVALLLIVTYRSPWLWLVPLTVVGLGDQVAARLVAGGSLLLDFAIDESIIGITSVLVFGAGTNYALLLIARYREELRHVEDRHVAMTAAVRQAAPAILASSSTVVLALLSLALADTPSTRSLGYAGAIGIATAVLYALVLLPAALVLFGRRLFWPFVPRLGDADPTRSGPWARAGAVVVRRPLPVALGSVVLLLALAAGVSSINVGLAQDEQFRETPEAVSGQQALAAAFPAGSSEPTVLMTEPGKAQDVIAAARAVDGVQEVIQGPQAGDVVELQAVLTAAPETTEAFDIIKRLRAALVGDALVGGSDAQALDAQEAAAADRRVIIPAVLGIVVVILVLLLRSVVAALVLVATVVATYVSSLGASWWAFDRLFDFPALDLGVPLLGFLFLVALGVDYNIFLITRAREEAEHSDTRTAITVALAVTGGVITSAGILLAAVFAVLGVLPLITLTQLGILVGFGVLLDTLLVRSLLVPALVSMLGDRFWWPGNPRSSRYGGQGMQEAALLPGDLPEEERLTRPDARVTGNEAPAGS